MDNKNICSICGCIISGRPHSSQPVKKGISCDKCFNDVVKPRIEYLIKAIKLGVIEPE